MAGDAGVDEAPATLFCGFDVMGRMRCSYPFILHFFTFSEHHACWVAQLKLFSRGDRISYGKTDAMLTGDVRFIRLKQEAFLRTSASGITV